MDPTLKNKLLAIQQKALDLNKYASVTDPIHNMDPNEFNTILDAIKANNTDIEDLQTRMTTAENNDSAMQSQIATLQSQVSVGSNAFRGTRVVSTDPANNGVGVSSDKTITVVVDQFLYAQSVNDTNIQLKDVNGAIIPITVGYDGVKTITINHVDAFSISASPYSLHIGTGVLNTVGDTFNDNSEYVLGFSCGTDNFPSKPVITYDTVTRNSARIILSTPATDDVGLSKYILSYGDGTVIANPVTLPYTFPSLLDVDKDYTVKLGAVDTAGQTTWSDPVTFHTLAHAVPTAPVLNNPTIGNMTASVAVGTASTLFDGATLNTYNWYVRQSGQTLWTSDGQGASPHSFNGLTNNVGYEFCAETVDSMGGVSAKSNVVTGTPTGIIFQDNFDGGLSTAWDTDHMDSNATSSKSSSLNGKLHFDVWNNNNTWGYIRKGLLNPIDITKKTSFKMTVPKLQSGAGMWLMHFSNNNNNHSSADSGAQVRFLDYNSLAIQGFDSSGTETDPANNTIWTTPASGSNVVLEVIIDNTGTYTTVEVKVDGVSIGVYTFSFKLNNSVYFKLSLGNGVSGTTKTYDFDNFVISQ